jgi:predicted homoserine dehydrogenase-like protein
MRDLKIGTSLFEDDPIAEEYDKYGRVYRVSSADRIFTVSSVDELIDYKSSLGFRVNYHKNQRKPDHLLKRKRNLHQRDRIKR